MKRIPEAGHGCYAPGRDVGKERNDDGHDRSRWLSARSQQADVRQQFEYPQDVALRREFVRDDQRPLVAEHNRADIAVIQHGRPRPLELDARQFANGRSPDS